MEKGGVFLIIIFFGNSFPFCHFYHPHTIKKTLSSPKHYSTQYINILSTSRVIHTVLAPRGHFEFVMTRCLNVGGFHCWLEPNRSGRQQDTRPRMFLALEIFLSTTGPLSADIKNGNPISVPPEFKASS